MALSALLSNLGLNTIFTVSVKFVCHYFAYSVLIYFLSERISIPGRMFPFATAFTLAVLSSLTICPIRPGVSVFVSIHVLVLFLIVLSLEFPSERTLLLQIVRNSR